MGKDQNVRESSGWIKHADFMLLDIICLILSFSVAYKAYLGGTVTDISSNWMNFLVLFTLIDLVVTLLSSPYSGVFEQPGYVISIKSIKLAVYIFIVSCVIFYAFKIGENYSRGTLFITLLLYVLSSIIVKVLWRSFVLKSNFFNASSDKKSMVVVTDKLLTEDNLNDILVGDRASFYIKAIYVYGDEEFANQFKLEDVEILHGKEGYNKYVIENSVDGVFFTTKERHEFDNAIKELVKCGVNVFINIEDIIGFQADEQTISRLGVYNTLKVRSHSLTAQQKAYIKAKRTMDIIVGIVGCLITALLAVVIKVIYVLNGDFAPIIFKQTRVGRNGKLIEIYKFRTMVATAEEDLKELLKDPRYKREWDECQKLSDDPRLTKIGKIMRRCSIDEFPQFINVLIGNMSFIGPRPLVPQELEKHSGLKIYNMVKPGITGWWACNGRSNIQYNERLELEYFYIQNICFELDVLVLMRTVKAVFVKRGAI